MGWRTLSVKPDTHQKLKEISTNENRPMSDIINDMVDAYHNILLEDMRKEPQIQQMNNDNENQYEREIEGETEFIL